MKRNIFGALMTLIVASVIAVPAVHAQRILTADVPFAFTVSTTQMPAGAYEVAQLGDRATLIETRDGHDKVLGLYNSAGPSKAGETKLVFDRIGDRYFLSEVKTDAVCGRLAPPRLERELASASNQPVAAVIVAALTVR